MDINEICNEIDLIIAKKDNQMDYKYIHLSLNDALTKEISYEEIDLMCETIIKIAKTKNRILRHLEKYFWSFINDFPFYLILNNEVDIEENEELLSNTDYPILSKRIFSRVTGLAQEVLELKDDNSKGSDLRRAGSLSLLGEMINYYQIPCAKDIFLNSIISKNPDEQYKALQGLENYYAFSEDDIEDDLIKTLNAIKAKTDDRTIASTCLQILINAGIISEMTAIFEIDDWKEEHED